ncbi:MAG: DNA polymerase I [Candidatus Omnitrophica bacterium]|nr:DNA polymerase I [Candidatus Omnitrophota bacterium]MDD5436611.1 DNA polymerase I [Candidatus Omnitrophota bacterium]
MSGKKLFLIDGNSFCYRAFYAIRALTNSKGQPTNAIYGFVTMLNKIVKDNKPDMLAVAFDMKGPTFRHKKYEDYKIQRKPMPDDLVGQMPHIKKMVSAYNIPIFEIEGYEADDVLATIARRAEEKGIETFIVTGDKDALQIIDSHIKVYSTHKDGLIYDAGKVKEEYGVEPNRMIDIMGLMGDAIDNIPGVKGIGEKTAVELITQFGSLDNLYKNIDKVKGDSKKRILTEHKDMAYLSRELAILDENVPIKINFDELRMKESDQGKLLEYFKEFEFKSLLKDVTPKGTLKSAYTLIEDGKAFDKLVEHLSGLKEFAFDFETTSEDPMLAEPVGVSFSWKVGEAHYVPMNLHFTVAQVMGALKPVFENEKIKKIGQNIKYEYIVLANQGIGLKGISFDTMVASYVLNPSKLNHNLEDISLEYLSHKLTTPIEELLGKGKNAITMDKVDVKKVADYCCEDSDVTLRLKNILAKEMEEKGLDKLFKDVEIPLIEVLAIMEINGVAIDKGYLAGLSKDMGRKLDKLTGEIYKIAGEEFNINSPKQLSKILFEKLELPVLKKTKTGASTNEEVLVKLADKHELPKVLLEYRQLAKLKSTYVDSLPELINPKTERVHTSFNQTVTATGRLSSSGPNLQNIPIRTEEGRKIRRAFIPSEGNLLLSADYSQIELRILAHLSGDKQLTKAFKEGLDIHAFTASLVFGIKEKDVTSEMRGMAKTVNFGIVYGMSPYGLSQSLGIDVNKAKEFIDAYFERYPDVKTYLESLIAEAREKGFVSTILGRRRYIPEINNQNMQIRQFAERTAINAPIQGSAADVIKVAMIEIEEKLSAAGMKTKMTLQVHDELVFDVPKGELDKAAKIVKEGMEDIIKLKVPVEAHVEIGKNWLEMEPYKK